jgi:hypothetical protein
MHCNYAVAQRLYVCVPPVLYCVHTIYVSVVSPWSKVVTTSLHVPVQHSKYRRVGQAGVQEHFGVVQSRMAATHSGIDRQMDDCIDRVRKLRLSGRLFL